MILRRLSSFKFVAKFNLLAFVAIHLKKQALLGIVVSFKACSVDDCLLNFDFDNSTDSTDLNIRLEEEALVKIKVFEAHQFEATHISTTNQFKVCLLNLACHEKQLAINAVFTTSH